MKKTRKPKEIRLGDGSATCISEDYDDMGGGAFCIEVYCQSIYTSKDTRKLIKWLEHAALWIENKEKK